METLFWNDRWINGWVPRFLWSEEFSCTQYPNGTVGEMSFLFDQAPFSSNMEFMQAIERLRGMNGEMGDQKWWLLAGNSKF